MRCGKEDTDWEAGDKVQCQMMSGKYISIERVVLEVNASDTVGMWENVQMYYNKPWYLISQSFLYLLGIGITMIYHWLMFLDPELFNISFCLGGLMRISMALPVNWSKDGQTIQGSSFLKHLVLAI